jgi:uncharacterized protein YbbC (DUF1343 family)
VKLLSLSNFAFSGNMKIALAFLLAFILADCKTGKVDNNSGTGSADQQGISAEKQKAGPVTGAEQLNEYLPLLKGKSVGLVVNHTSLAGKTHIVDTLLTAGVKIKTIFAPEHGFRGDADAGEKIKSSVDAKTGIPYVSLYGSNYKPTPEQLAGLDIVIFDIQDVGTRFYTYISTMHYVMEACAENNITFLVLDRPNPNGFYVDGPVRQPELKSFVGTHPIPIVHGLTVAELAQMINGEKWLAEGRQCSLQIVKIRNYEHSTRYFPPVRPSPNLPNDLAINLYPSLCLFEGTEISVGRGTQFPFQIIGAPSKVYGDFTFTPVSIPGMSKFPPHENKLCYGLDFRNLKPDQKFTLKYLIDMYNKSDNKEKFFNKFFFNLSGTKELKEQIISGMSENEIRKTWETELAKYREIRKKYLLYPDFRNE